MDLLLYFLTGLNALSIIIISVNIFLINLKINKKFNSFEKIIKEYSDNLNKSIEDIEN